MARMALRASTNGAVLVWLADCVALFATGGGCRMPFRNYEWVGRTLGATGLKLFAERNLFRSQSLLTLNGGPTGGSVPTAEEFLIHAFVAGTAVASSQASADNESMMIHLLLASGGLVAIEAIDALLRMSGHFIFV